MKAVFLDYGTMGPDLDLSPLTDLVPDLELFDITPDDLTAERVRDMDIVFTNKIQFDEAVLRNAKSLRLIGLTATGTDNVDLVGLIRLKTLIRGGDGDKKRAISTGEREIICHPQASSVTKNRFNVSEPLAFTFDRNPFADFVAE